MVQVLEIIRESLAFKLQSGIVALSINMEETSIICSLQEETVWRAVSVAMPYIKGESILLSYLERLVANPGENRAD